MALKINPTGVVDRLYVLNAGLAVVPDRSVYSPGYRVGEPITLSCNAYLIQRAGEWMMWDTGIEDAIINIPGGRVIAHEIRGIVARTIEAQLGDVGIKPTDVTRVALSHAHFDHVGNAALFAHATWYLQRSEFEAMMGKDYEKYGYVPSLYQSLKDARLELLEGDFDIFGDGSVTVLSTPGHTLGHSSMLVRLAHAGPILLSGDVAHYQFTLCNCCVPSMNADPAATKQSMNKVQEIVRREGAALWLNHDIVQNATIPHAPAYFD